MSTVKTYILLALLGCSALANATLSIEVKMDAAEDSVASKEWTSILDQLEAGSDEVAAKDGNVAPKVTQCEAVGKASFYHEGSKTASGERFNADGISAAHRTLPFGTQVKVKNLKTGRTVVVRINDRGPFIHGRIIDLSRGAARVIGLESAGVGQIQMSCI